MLAFLIVLESFCETGRAWDWVCPSMGLLGRLRGLTVVVFA